MATKKVHHVVKRPGRKPGDSDVDIPVAEDLVTEPGIPKMEKDVSFLQSHRSSRDSEHRQGGGSGVGLDPVHR